METLRVDLGERSYPIYIGAGLLPQLAQLLPPLKGKQVLVVTNTTIAPLYLDVVMAGLQGYQVSSVILPDGEQFKTLDTLNLVYTALLENRHSRNTTLVALGGGVIGDITGFAAASYQRGVDFIQIPTTLLSQVDSSVGGKTGVNHVLGKNMIGAFHQPKAVIADRLSAAEEMLAARTANSVAFGTGVPDASDDEQRYPRAANVLNVAAERLAAKKVNAPGDAQAIYFRRGT